MKCAALAATYVQISICASNKGWIGQYEKEPRHQKSGNTFQVIQIEARDRSTYSLTSSWLGSGFGFSGVCFKSSGLRKPARTFIILWTVIQGWIISFNSMMLGRQQIGMEDRVVQIQRDRF